ncbi:MAG: hypothetical protein U0694_13575 [Anaerolineae bacterium]
MKDKGESKREFVFAASFTLRDSMARLRSLAQKRRWKLEIEPIDSEHYSFQAALRRWMPLSISGTLTRDGDKNTIVDGKVDIHWPLLSVLMVSVTALVLFQWSYPLAMLDNLRIMNKFWDWSSPATWLMAALTVTILLGQAMLAAGIFLGIRWLFGQHKQMANAIGNTLMDAIPDLPLASQVSANDGELITLVEGVSPVEAAQQNLSDSPEFKTGVGG